MNPQNINPQLEHINLTVKNPDQIANYLKRIFGWEIRWVGPSKDVGSTIHVGNKQTGASYLALYTHETLSEAPARNHLQAASLNHIGVTVDNLQETEQKVLAEGFKTHNHGDYQPGSRFYFDISPEIEVEVISYHQS